MRTPAKARALGPQSVSERDFTEQIRQLATTLGWLRYHAWTSIRSPSGWPDEALVRAPRVVLAELKSEAGRVTDPQRRWLDELAGCPGVEVYLWRPSMLEAIAELLQSTRGPELGRWKPDRARLVGAWLPA